jgi:hypothetical protein
VSRSARPADTHIRDNQKLKCQERADLVATATAATIGSATEVALGDGLEDTVGDEINARYD